MKQVAIVGIQGLPARYGGFETLVENIIGVNCSEEIAYTVFCSGKDYESRRKEYKGARLKYIPLLHANGMQSMLYDVVCLTKCMRGYDVVVVLGTSGCLFLPVFRLFFHKRLMVNIDGLEHRRAKWGKFARWILRMSEKVAVRYADVVIADNKAIVDYVDEVYRKKAALIAYGGDHVKRHLTTEQEEAVLKKYGLKRGEYAVCICRIEPENNCELTCRACAENGKVLVFIGNWMHSAYSRQLMKRYEGCGNIRIISSLYDLDELYALRNNCSHYIHGHSAGGTNPSLVEAMFFGKPILAYDVVYNRETMNGRGYFYTNAEELAGLLERTDLKGEELKRLAEERYTWKRIAKQYEALYGG